MWGEDREKKQTSTGKGGGGAGAKQDRQQQEIITKIKKHLQGNTHVNMEKMWGGGDTQANIMWPDLLIYMH